jgi:hypothetical protein
MKQLVNNLKELKRLKEIMKRLIEELEDEIQS